MERKLQRKVIHNKKGGVGKSSLGINIAASLAGVGFYVGIVDGDSQANSTSLALPRRKFKWTLTDIVCGAVKTSPSGVEEKVTLLDGMVQVRKRLWVVPSDKHLGRAVEHIRAEKDYEILVDLTDQLEKMLQNPPPIEERFSWWKAPKIDIGYFQLEPTSNEEFISPPPYLDFLIFDTPPNEDELTISMVYASQGVVVPSQMEEFSAMGIAQMVDGLHHRFRKRVDKIKIEGIYPNMILHSNNNTMPLDYLESLWKHFPDLARRPVHHDKTIPESQGLHVVALEHRRDSRATREICAIALELAGYEGTLAGLPICELCTAAVNRAFEESEGIGV